MGNSESTTDSAAASAAAASTRAVAPVESDAADSSTSAKRAKTDDAADEQAEVNRSRRQSRRSYSERRSLFSEQFQAQKASELYKSIDERLPPAQRFVALLKACLEKGIDQVAESSAGQRFTGFKTHAQRVCESFVASVEQEKLAEAITQRQPLRPNPVNEVMRKDLKAFESLKDQLTQEEAAWEAAIADAKRHLENTTTAVCDTGEGPIPSWLPAARAAELATVVDITQLSTSSFAGSEEWHTRLQVQVATLEAATSTLTRLCDEAARYSQTQQAKIASGAFAGYAEMNEPAKLIRNITKAGHQADDA